MVNIIESVKVPDETYYRLTSVEPEIKGDKIIILNGTGTERKSWGKPGVTSTVVLQDDDLVAIHVGFFHKHGGGQFWRYYRPEQSTYQQVSWLNLSDEERQCVLDACKKNAPPFAKVPGKLRSERITAKSNMRIAYKVVRVVDGRYYSVYNPAIEYVLGKRLKQKAVEDHGGGYYSYPDIELMKRRLFVGTLFPKRCYQDLKEVAILRCEISGNCIIYDDAKVASSYIKPLEVVEEISLTKEEVFRQLALLS